MVDSKGLSPLAGFGAEPQKNYVEPQKNFVLGINHLCAKVRKVLHGECRWWQ